ncbi:hypothetical protein NVV95_02725 [Herbiconiux sp. CPCC 205716]|uniref:Uncharacterized protein n=1 Tax=Herbiconiux gentiana TaxID=2970912 RepID=A0ABT2GEZ1_9MICO|nr:hypothetical protein [Herbiconiux gentiana]MCS5713464.1 hypothetical protein [Herbiconiux gentiana]
MTDTASDPAASDTYTSAGGPDTAGQPYTRDGGRPDPEHPPTIVGADAENVVMVQTSGSTWDVRVSGTDDLVGAIAKSDGGYRATDARGSEAGEYDSPELAMFGIIARA